MASNKLELVSPNGDKRLIRGDGKTGSKQACGLAPADAGAGAGATS